MATTWTAVMRTPVRISGEAMGSSIVASVRTPPIPMPRRFDGLRVDASNPGVRVGEDRGRARANSATKEGESRGRCR